MHGSGKGAKIEKRSLIGIERKGMESSPGRERGLVLTYAVVLAIATGLYR